LIELFPGIGGKVFFDIQSLLEVLNLYSILFDFKIVIICDISGDSFGALNSQNRILK